MNYNKKYIVDLQSRFNGSLKLAAIGDALGWITEFEKSKQSLFNKYGTKNIDCFYSWKKNVGGRFHGYTDKIKKGSYSDDTQLILAVARSIDGNGIVNQKYFSKVELPDWLKYSRGAGRTVKNAARKIQRKSANWNNNFYKYKVGEKTIDYRECGANGAAMRILPIALANFNDFQRIKEEIFKNSIITHGHPRAIVGAILYGLSVDTILKEKPESFDIRSFITKIGKNMSNRLSLTFLEKSELKIWENDWNKGSNVSFKELYNKTIVEAEEYLRIIYVHLKKELTDFEALKMVGCFENETKGSGLSTVIASIYLLCKYYKEPLKGIEVAVNSIGTDTDSIASFTGGLLGAFYGQQIIPSKWEKFQDHNYIDEVAGNLLLINSKRKKANSKTKNLKPISDLKIDILKEGDVIYINSLGEGKVTNVDRQKTLISNNYNIIIDVEFKIGQSCRFSKLFKDANIDKTVDKNKSSQQTKLF